MIHHGDCLDALKTLPDNSVDSLVTDPPAGISFMGKHWDGDLGGRLHWIAWMTLVMSECKRVMKPGAHGLVWALPRTSHWTATALEEAGFEMRDVICHLFGSGFPKSLDVSKAIDRAAGAEREIVGKKEYAGGHVQNSTGHMVGGKFNASHGVKSDADQRAITAPATEDAKRWAGWGTALKPSVERWLLVRKPLTTVPLDSILREVTRQIEELICRTAPAKFAERVFTSNPSASNEVQSGFAQWLADVSHTILSGESSELTAMFNSPAAASTFLNTALSWNAFLDALFDLPSKSITATETGLITDLKTLSCLISRTTRASTTRDGTSDSGGSSSAPDAAPSLSAIETLLLTLGRHFAQEPVSTPAGLYFEQSSALLKHESGTHEAGWSNDFILVRKPLSEKTVAKNVLRWGTGALNIDASRIANEGKSTLRPVGKSAYQRSTGAVTLGVPGRQDLESDVSGGHTQGRFPANLVLSCDCPGTEHGQLCAVHMLDKQSGFSKTPKSVSRNARKDTGKYGDFGAVTTACAGDSWGASRFFYVAKVSSSERNAGLEGMPAKLRADSNKMMGESGAMKTGSGNDRTTHFQNHHPTVKPQKLMRYLIRMVTPPGGVVLDPFAGSGSTLVAAKSLGFEFVGIEREQEYHAIASKRVDHAKERP